MAKKTFEQSMKQLERIVQELEDGDLPLEKAIQKFEEGIRLSKQCTEMLDNTEKKISILLKDQNGNTFEKPFSSDEASSHEE
jgi:exodeoxyribonuclease VII small subunit